jgi:hypothetical protein
MARGKRRRREGIRLGVGDPYELNVVVEHMMFTTCYIQRGCHCKEDPTTVIADTLIVCFTLLLVIQPNRTAGTRRGVVDPMQ